MCLCGAKFQADTADAAWLLLDQHCDDTHGKRWPRNVLRKGEYSTSRKAVASRRRRRGDHG